ncbi:phosphoheptose isomerase [Aureimonas sp. SA4125]|uniref:SIS domain-containing protein n=1 Tax=Aureimonas sp. SA4125 TaxID=2826993 RepID=UPI001CC67EAE|nr:SIS domain-containing protein [Aureimonas sp. SA4125]BDA83931.1 phosphoheptose isomerase [Aureimonas sp. SA4125]
MQTVRKLPAAAPVSHFADYARRTADILTGFDWTDVAALADDLFDCATTGRQVFLCGNGGSGGNANHLANDFLYAWSKTSGMGIRVSSLAANPAVLTCLANDEGYENVFSLQLAVQARPGDLLIAFSGSGNSPNIVKAIQEARRIGMRSYAVLGFSGGKCKALADVPIHFETEDMQIAEDMQTVIGHMIVQYLASRRSELRL